MTSTADVQSPVPLAQGGSTLEKATPAPGLPGRAVEALLASVPRLLPLRGPVSFAVPHERWSQERPPETVFKQVSNAQSVFWRIRPRTASDRCEEDTSRCQHWRVPPCKGTACAGACVVRGWRISLGKVSRGRGLSRAKSVRWERSWCVEGTERSPVGLGGGAGEDKKDRRERRIGPGLAGPRRPQ